MTYLGHVENGVIVFDGSAPLPEGTVVQILPLDSCDESDHAAIKSRRGTTYLYEDPFGPACDESDWDALR